MSLVKGGARARPNRCDSLAGLRKRAFGAGHSEFVPYEAGGVPNTTEHRLCGNVKGSSQSKDRRESVPLFG